MSRKKVAGTVVKRKNAKTGKVGYMPRYYVFENGQRRDKYGRLHATQKEAKAELADLTSNINAGRHIDKSDLTVELWLREWLDVWNTEAGPKTKERYRQSFEWYVYPRIGSVKLQELEPETVQRMYTHLAQNGRTRNVGALSAGLQPATIRVLHNTLKFAFKKAVALRKISVNPFDEARPPTRKAPTGSTNDPTDATSVIKDCLSQDQLSALLDAFKEHPLHTLVMVAAATGCRRGELLALTWDAVDLDKGVLHVRQTLEATGEGETRTLRVKPPKTDAGVRSIGLPASAVSALREHRAEQRRLAGQVLGSENVSAMQPRGALVFPRKPWKPIEHRDPGLLSANFSAAALRRGFKVHLHQLRHTHASLLLRAGVPIPDVSARLGHSNPAMTLKVYSHAIPSDQSHTVAAVDRMLGGNSGTR